MKFAFSGTILSIFSPLRGSAPPAFSLNRLQFAMVRGKAEAIHSHPVITGFCFHTRPHVIHLFADVVILMLYSSTLSLTNAHHSNILQIYFMLHSELLQIVNFRPSSSRTQP